MKKIPQIKTVMTPFPYSIDIDKTVLEARQFMREQNIRHLPVTEAGELVGITSDRDIKLVLGSDPAPTTKKPPRVGDIYQADAFIVDLSEPLDNVLVHMAAHHIGSAIVTRRGKLVGVFTVTDACHHFGEYLRNPFRSPGGDDAA